jgi:hypothetical protein
VVKDWSLATIYKGMGQFMILQVVAIALLIIFPPIATWFPEYLQAEARNVQVEQVKDDAPSLEQDTMESMQEQSEREGASGEADRSRPADAK